jgi:hypothetical protein
VTAGLGLLSLSSHRTLPFGHPRNLLADIWAESPQSAVYPPAVWYLLSDPNLGPRPGRSQVHSIRQRWLHYGQLDAATSANGKRQQALLFGPGGTYRAEELDLRSNMLNEVQSVVRLLNQDLQGLLLAVLNPK